MNTKNKIILDTWMGLGDNLQVSTIPRRLFEKHSEKCVWISTAVKRRNPEIDQLVWESNPYIAGFTDEPGINYTHLLQFKKYGWIENWERIYNIEQPFSTKPEVYFKGIDKDYNIKDEVVIDISYSKDSYKENVINKQTTNNFKKILYKLAEQTDKPFYKIINTKLNNNSSFEFFDILCPDIKTKTINTENIFEYATAVMQCKQFVCTHSGNHALASALRKNSICLIPQDHYNKNYFVFSNVRYYTV